MEYFPLLIIANFTKTMCIGQVERIRAACMLPTLETLPRLRTERELHVYFLGSSIFTASIYTM